MCQIGTLKPWLKQMFHSSSLPNRLLTGLKGFQPSSHLYLFTIFSIEIILSHIRYRFPRTSFGSSEARYILSHNYACSLARIVPRDHLVEGVDDGLTHIQPRVVHALSCCVLYFIGLELDRHQGRIVGMYFLSLAS